MSGAIEPGLWIALVLGCCVLGRSAFRVAREQGEGRFLGTTLASACVLRLLAPFAPTNWYWGFDNMVVDPAVYTRRTTFVPLPSRLLLELGAGLLGLRVLNLFLGVATVAAFWLAAHFASETKRCARMVACLFAFVPVYVRYSASDASHLTILFAWAVSAAAFTSIVRGGASRFLYATLFAGIVVGAVIRAESSVLFLLLPFLLDGGKIWNRNWRRHGALMGTSAVAVALALAVVSIMERQAIADHGVRLTLKSVLVALAFRVLCIPNPIPPFYFPPILAVPVLAYAVRCLRIRDLGAVLGLYAPILLAGIPSMFNLGVAVDLASAGYDIVAVTFFVLPCARALDLFWDDAAAYCDATPAKRFASVMIRAAVIAVFAFVPYGYRYAFQSELKFVRDALPKSPATVLTIFDPETDAGDLDCCLSMPYPGVFFERPDLKWIVLKKGDERRIDPALLSFDFYYPGSMPQLDETSLDGWFAKLVNPNPERRARLREHLRAVRALDQSVRTTFSLEPWRQKAVLAHTSSSVAFADDRVTLTLFRRRDGATSQ